MKDVRIAVAALTEIIKKNRETHVAEFKDAKAKFAENLIARLEEMMEKARKGEYDQHVGLPEPVSHEDDYDTVLRMLELSDDKVVTLTYAEFRQYVEDEWQWKRSFSASNDFNAVYHSETTVKKRSL